MTSSANTSHASQPSANKVSGLGARTGRGMLWSGLESFVMAAASLIVSIVLARLVAPDAFGLIAMLQIFIAVGQMFAEAGIGQALIRLPNRSRSLESAALYINSALALLAYVILWCVAPLISDFYHQSELTPIVRFITLTIPLAGVCVVQNARLSSQMDFKRPALVSLISVIVGGIVGIVLAIRGLGVYALVWQQLTVWSVKAALLWSVCPWKPTSKIPKSETLSMLHFSWKLLVSGLIDTIYVNMYAPLVGRFFTPMLTAMYWRADSLARYAPLALSGILQKVSLPAISHIRDDKQRTRRAYEKLIKASALLLFPVSALCISLATPLFSWLLTDKWLSAVPYFRILSLSLALYPLHALNCTALNVFGRSDKFLKLEVIKKIVGVTALCVCLPLGVEALCWGILTNSVICLIINIRFARLYTEVGIASHLHLILPIAFFALLAAMAANAGTYIFDNVGLQTVAGIVIGVAIYLLLIVALSRQDIEYLKSVFKNKP